MHLWGVHLAASPVLPWSRVPWAPSLALAPYSRWSLEAKPLPAQPIRLDQQSHARLHILA